MQQGPCDCCQQEAYLTPIINRDPRSDRDIDMVCADCATLDQFEHIHAVKLYSLPARYRSVLSTDCLDESIA